jgi:hypothetical protein
MLAAIIHMQRAGQIAADGPTGAPDTAYRLA